MTNEELAKEIANGLIDGGFEGGFDAVSCSTAGDYQSLGCSQWEGGRADDLLSRIEGGDYYIGRTYSDIDASGELDALSELLDSEQGQDAQREKLAEDTLDYVEALTDIECFDDSRAIIYAGIWCPTSTYVVTHFIARMAGRGEKVNDLYTLAIIFKEEYARAAGCEEYAEGYANRAMGTYNLVREMDLSEYGVPEYD